MKAQTMPQGNDLKDAKDIDPLGMTRDLFGTANAPQSGATAPPPAGVSEQIAAPPAALAGVDGPAPDQDLTEEAKTRVDRGDVLEAPTYPDAETRAAGDMAKHDPAAATPGFDAEESPETDSEAHDSDDGLTPDEPFEQERVTNLRDEITQELGTLLEELETDPQTENTPNP